MHMKKTCKDFCRLDYTLVMYCTEQGRFTWRSNQVKAKCTDIND